MRYYSDDAIDNYYAKGFYGPGTDYFYPEREPENRCDDYYEEDDWKSDWMFDEN